MIVAYIDGGARGNPGPAGFGVRIENEDGTLVEEFGEAIGVATNNVAEYRSLIAALDWIKRRGHTRAHIRSDSELLVQQMLGKYKVRNPGLQPLHAKARLLAAEIGRVTFEHVERARNAHADRLANAAMDRAAGRSRANSGPAKNPLTPLERSVRILIYRQFLQTGRVPDVEAIARDTGASERDVVSALRRLADLHAIVLAPATTNIWMAHPFSAVPTAYPVVANGISYWANCAWDAAGIVALAGGTGEARTRCADCGAELVMTVRDGRVDGDAVVHYAVPPRKFWENIAYT